MGQRVAQTADHIERCVITEEVVEGSIDMLTEGDVSAGGDDPTARLARLLRDHHMRLDEIRAVLGAGEPVIVRRHMELHRERLTEQFADQLQKLAALERILVQRSMIAGRPRPKAWPT